MKLQKRIGVSDKPVLLNKFEYNSPVILTYALICVVLFVLNTITAGWLNKTLLTTFPHSRFGIMTILRSVLYIFGHSGMSHLTGNMMLFLLVGPIVEERYGSSNLILMIFSTAIVTAFVNNFLNSGIIGASGIVFMLIILSAFTSTSKDRIPITLVMVFLIYVGNEVVTGIAHHGDNISQFGHISGGICGLIWGIILHKTGSYVKK